MSLKIRKKKKKGKYLKFFLYTNFFLTICFHHNYSMLHEKFKNSKLSTVKENEIPFEHFYSLEMKFTLTFLHSLKV